MVDLLVVGLQDELAEGATAVSVDLQGIKPSQLNIKQPLTFFLSDTTLHRRIFSDPGFDVAIS